MKSTFNKVPWGFIAILCHFIMVFALSIQLNNSDFLCFLICVLNLPGLVNFFIRFFITKKLEKILLDAKNSKDNYAKIVAF